MEKNWGDTPSVTLILLSDILKLRNVDISAGSGLIHDMMSSLAVGLIWSI